MERAKFWIDFDNGDLCRADGTAIACMKAAHCDPTPENLEELDKILKDAPRLQEQVKLLREALEKLRARVREMPCGHYTPRIHDAAAEATKTLEATKEEA